MLKKPYLIALILLVNLILLSCKHDHAPHAPHAHEEDEEARMTLTAYSDDFEVFAEADPFCIGETSTVLAHFSVLPDFKPLDSATITMRLVVAGVSYAETIESPLKKGIYRFQVTPENAGEGHIVFDIRSHQQVFQVTVPGIVVFDTKENAHNAAVMEEVPVNTTVFTKEQSWKVTFATGLPVRELFGPVIKTTAHVQPSQLGDRLIIARTNGVVEFSEGHLLSGKTVSPGQVLFNIATNVFADNNASVRFVEASNAYQQSKADYERLKELQEDQIVSEKEVLHAKTEYENAKVKFDHLKAHFSVAGQQVVSPLKGLVEEVFVRPGDYVEAGQPLVRVANHHLLMLHADVQQKYAGLLHAIHRVNIRTLADKRTYSLDELNGEVLSYGKSVRQDNFQLPLVLQIQNNGKFVPGGFVEVYLSVLSDTNSLTVPNTALLEEQGTYFVYVQVTPEVFEKRVVRKGATDGKRTVIRQGISEDERVVTQGAISIQLNQATGSVDPHSGHVH